MVEIANAVADALAEIDGRSAARYHHDGDAYVAELRGLDAEMEAGLARCERRLLVTAHDAFGWLARRYDLEPRGIAGISPDAEPDAAKLAELADLAAEQHVTTIFTESLVSPDIAKTLAREAGGLRTAVLDPFEGLTGERRSAGEDYLSVMRENLYTLRSGLGCE